MFYLTTQTKGTNMLKVTTTYKTNAAGRSQILAKGQGRQATVNVDQSKSNDWNHGTAAGSLLLKLGLNETDVNSPMTHEANDSGTVHTFTVGA